MLVKLVVIASSTLLISLTRHLCGAGQVEVSVIRHFFITLVIGRHFFVSFVIVVVRLSRFCYSVVRFHWLLLILSFVFVGVFIVAVRIYRCCLSLWSSSSSIVVVVVIFSSGTFSCLVSSNSHLFASFSFPSSLSRFSVRIRCFRRALMPKSVPGDHLFVCLPAFNGAVTNLGKINCVVCTTCLVALTPKQSNIQAPFTVEVTEPDVQHSHPVIIPGSSSSSPSIRLDSLSPSFRIPPSILPPSPEPHMHRLYKKRLQFFPTK